MTNEDRAFEPNLLVAVWEPQREHLRPGVPCDGPSPIPLVMAAELCRRRDEIGRFVEG